jgi:hypothetical protein
MQKRGTENGGTTPCKGGRVRAHSQSRNNPMQRNGVCSPDGVPAVARAMAGLLPSPRKRSEGGSAGPEPGPPPRRYR